MDRDKELKSIVEAASLNMKVIESLRESARIATKNKCNNELLEITQTIQIIRYDNDKLLDRLIKLFEEKHERHDGDGAGYQHEDGDICSQD